MNRTQKNAWFGLVNCLLAIVFCVFFLGRAFFCVPVPGYKFQPQPSQGEIVVRAILWFGLLILLPIIALIVLLIPRKKESPAEPDFDEMDAAIQNKAIRISFISVWLLWPLALVLIMLNFGITGALPAIFYLYLHLGVFLFCMTVYFLTKIRLYQKQTKGASNE